ncbi:MAG: hypothetical protein APF80_01715 [Alphaproteobacteria bacterium BRH_c36]|nr:MAG: hypothetical protein APF80_01715 [Alphaproteobacteria bacterium BRH_c36]
MIGCPAQFRSAGILLVICFGLASPSIAISKDPPAEPYRLVHSLSVEHNKILHGDRAALATLQARLVETSNALLSADKAVWPDNPRNARAVIKLVLSGGPPDILKKLVEAKLLAQPYLPLGAATLAFAEGRKAEAHRYFKDIDHRKLEPSLGGHVSLVKALVSGAMNSNEAYALLDEACLLSPGTIVEEASLRRHAPAMASMGELKRFEALATRYLRRFPNSLYADGLLSQIGVALAEHDYGSSPPRAKFFESVLSLLAIDKQQALLSSVIKESLALGHIATARLALDRMSALPPAGGTDVNASGVYAAATLILTDDFEAGVAALAGVNTSRLEKRERELAEAANRLIDSIAKNTDAAEITSRQPDEPASTQTAPGADEGKAENEALSSSRKTLGMIDKYLAELDL